MKRRYTYILLLLAAVVSVLASCQEEVFEPMPDVPEGYVKVSFGVSTGDFVDVDTKAVDPDGGGINSMVLFCFDVYGIFISTVKADVTPDSPSSVTGKFTATIPESTVFIHFVGNQNHDTLNQSDFYNKSEASVMEQLEASSGRMIYWGRKVLDVKSGAKPLNTQLQEASPITLIRNHAMITVNPEVSGGSTMVIEEMAVYNSYAFGTVCPWHPTLKFDFTWPSAEGQSEFVTIPTNKAKHSDVDRTTTSLSRYVYEHENSLDDPISVIIKASKGTEAPKYYRVLLLDNNSEPILIRRNHNYIINIVGDLNYGRDDFMDAVEAPATNNVWISVAENIKEIRDKDYSLAVEETAIILDESYTVVPKNTYTLTYTYESLDENVTLDAEDDKPEVSWIAGNTVGYHTLDNIFTVDGNKGTGRVEVSLTPMPDGVNMQEGTLMVKKGRLFRRVKIYTVRTMDFLPAWASAEVYGGASTSAFTPSNVTVMFTIPEECPEEIFPMKVLLSCNKLDVRFIAAGNGYDAFTLPIINEGEEGYGEPNAFGYKYVFEVEKAGVQRVYMRNSMYEQAGDATTVRIEAPFFESITKEVTFIDHTKTIIPLMKSISGYSSDGQPLGDETVYYTLVPQKKNAIVEFGMKLASSSSSSSSVALGADDEFLIYSSSLVLLDGSDHYSDTGVTDGCEYFQVPNLIWENSSNGRMMAFRPITGGGSTNENGYKLRFRTNKAQSDEIVRMTSIPFADEAHPAGYSPFTGKAVFANLGLFEGLTELTDESMAPFKDYKESETCNGYRSTTFELSNYNPFRFGAVVTFAPDQADFNQTTLTGLKRVFGDSDVPEATDHTSKEKETVMEWPYRPESQVDIAIDVTSFGGSDNKSVDPFGMQFDIYIDAPMLSIDKGERYPTAWKNAVELRDKDGNPVKDGDQVIMVDKLRAEEDAAGNPTGRFIYTVFADERIYAANHPDDFTTARIPDTKNLEDKETSYTPGDYSRDRRTLPFVVSNIVSQGEIKIHSDKEMAVFYDKTFKVTNVARNMKLTYGDNESSKTDVPLNAFVSFELKENHNRIGVITMQPPTQQGRNCSLRLRAEYKYDWVGDDVIIRWQDQTTKKVYTNEVKIKELNDQKKSFDLEYLFKNSEIHLLPQPATTN